MSTYASENAQANALGLTIVEFHAVERELDAAVTELRGRGMMVIACLACLRDREVTDGHLAGACPGCGDLGWAEVGDLARDPTFWIEGSRPPMPRLAGRELRNALAGFGLRAHAAPAMYVVPETPVPSHLLSDEVIDAAIARHDGRRR
jgi:hypothetical protein